MYSEDIFAIISLSIFVLITIIRLIQLNIYYEIKNAICVSYKKLYDIVIDSSPYYECIFEWTDNDNNKHNLKTTKAFKPRYEKTYQVLIKKNNINKGYCISHKYFLYIAILFQISIIVGIICI